MDDGSIGTDAARVMAAVEEVRSPDGVLVLMDLGSALMSAEMATEMIDPDGGPVELCAAPLVEGAVAAAARARGGRGAGGGRARGARRAADEDGAARRGGRRRRRRPPRRRAADGDALELRVTVEPRLGLHARPAARFTGALAELDARVEVSNATRGTGPGDGRSLTGLAVLGVKQGDEILVRATGPQAAEAIAALRALAADNFGDPREAGDAARGVRGRCGAPAPAAWPPRPCPAPPGPPPAGDEPAAAPAAGTELRGVAASHGIAIGPARHLRPPDAAGRRRARRHARGGARAARARAHGGPRRPRRRPRHRHGARERGRGGDLRRPRGPARRRRAHRPGRAPDRRGRAGRRGLARGRRRGRRRLPRARRRLPARARRRRRRRRAPRPRRARRHDRGARAAGRRASSSPTSSRRPRRSGSTPSRPSAIATARGGATAHAAILARALGIPAVVGLGAAVLAVPEGTPLVLDGAAGTLAVEPGPDAVAAQQRRREAEEEQRVAQLARAAEPGALRDGTPVEVVANVGSPDDARRAVEQGAEGIGLLRTEFLFLDRDTPPGEDEQVAVLREIAGAMDGRPVVIRTLDAGADKPLPFLRQEPEDNPFLGPARHPPLARRARAAAHPAARDPAGRGRAPRQGHVPDGRDARRAARGARAARRRPRRSWAATLRSRSA